MSENEVIYRLASLAEGSVIRRFAATIGHRALGIVTNVMIVEGPPPAYSPKKNSDHFPIIRLEKGIFWAQPALARSVIDIYVLDQIGIFQAGKKEAV